MLKKEKYQESTLFESELSQPIQPTTKIRFDLPQRAPTKVIVYDLLGAEVQTLINRELEACYHEIDLDANSLPSGVYFYAIKSGDYIRTRKTVLVK
jgi:hypothetical protein